MKIEKVKIKGFRGFANEKEFDLSAPVTIIFGENGTGKSSLLNAIEWCLFGKESIGKDTGIRERIDWEIKNRNSRECFVEIEVIKDNDKYTICRIWKSKTKDEISIEKRGGKKVEGEEAKRELNKILKNYTFKDFMSSVYQHQEVIRFILTQEPKNRDEAIDRLIGLSDYRNIIDGIGETKIKGDEFEKEINNLKERIKAKMDVWQEQIESKHKELEKVGVREEQISEDGLNDISNKIKEELNNFASEITTPLSKEFGTIDIKEPKRFVQTSKNEVNRLRSEMPDIKAQKEMYDQQSKIGKDLSDFNTTKHDMENRKRDLDKYEKEKGRLEEFEERKGKIEGEIKILEQQKENLSLLGTIIEKVIKYLESAPMSETNKCPVCGSVKDEILEHLKRDYQEKYKEKMEELDKKMGEKEDEIKKVREIVEEAKELRDRFGRTKENFENKEKEVRKKYNIPEREDVGSYLSKELEEIDKKLNNLKKKIEEKQNRLTDFEKEISKLEKISEVLSLKEQGEKTKEIEKSEIWRQLEKNSEKLKKFAEDLRTIINVIQNVSGEEAKTKINSIQGLMSDYFKNITNHPAIDELQFRVDTSHTGANSYSFKDKEGKEITTILSQGHYNSLALSIFLAMASLEDVQPFSFIMFDDPSQSLGRSEKEKLTEILNEVVGKKDLITSTMDEELFGLLSKLTKRKKIYKIEEWTPEGGPNITGEEK